MPDLFAYTDYRTFLADYYAERKKALSSFSYQVLARSAGFGNKGFVYNVIRGSRNLSKSSVVKLAQAMNLGAAEADYFETLVSFNQAKSLRERNYYFEKLNAITTTRKGAGRARQTRRDEHAFYAKWYYAVVRALLDISDFKGDYARLGKQVFPAIGAVEARKAVQLLLKLGLVQRRRNGRYVVTEKLITAGPEVVRLGLLNFQLQTAELAKGAVRDLPREKRHVSGVTVGVSRKTYEAMCGEIDALRARLLTLAEKDPEPDNVYQLNIQLFPVSNVDGSLTRGAASGKQRARGPRAEGRRKR